MFFKLISVESHQDTVLNNRTKCNTVINLSDHVLEPAEVNLLAKGLKFIPTNNRVDVTAIEDDLNNLIRRVKLKMYFHNDDKPDNSNTVNPLKIPSSFIPPQNKLPPSTFNIIDELRATTSTILASYKQDKNSKFITSTPHNLTRPEFTALHNLAKNDHIIIKPADKGGAIVILNKDDYIFEAERQLSDLTYYKPIPTPLLKHNVHKILLILNKLYTEKYINKKELDFLKPGDKCVGRHFYILPKIHKPITSWTIPDRLPPGRPIVSDCSTESSNICKFIDNFLTPLANKHPSYLKDTNDFISKIRHRIIPQDGILFTADVTSLYTNMDLNRTMAVVRRQLMANPVPGRPDDYILDLLNIIIKNNDFDFNGKTYLQCKGVSMGRSFCPALANLYLLDFDQQAMHSFKIKPILFFRYLDDIWGVFPGSEIELAEYEQWLSTRTPGISVTLKSHQSHIDFLDTTIYKFNFLGECRLLTKTFFKPTASHQLLHVQSFHPKHTSQGVLKSQILRYKRISSNYTDFKHTCEVVFKVLVERGYTRRNLIKMRNYIWNTSGEAKTDNEDKKTGLLPLITTYNPIGVRLAGTWRKILTSTTLNKNNRIIRAFKNQRNLKSYLVRSKFRPPIAHSSTLGTATTTTNNNQGNITEGFYPCNTPRCGACKIHATQSNTIYSSTLGTTFDIKHRLTCASKNIIYLITCNRCNLQYVGETTRALRERLTDHRSNIKTRRESPISIHFSSPLHSIQDLRIIAIEKIPDQKNSLLSRKDRENYWIRKLSTAHPQGLNDLPLPGLSGDI